MIRTRVAAFATLAAAAALAVGPSASAASDTVLTTTMNGAQEVPPVATTATGTASVFVDGDTSTVCIWLSFRNLTSNATNGHIHEEVAGHTGPVKVQFPLVFTGRTSAFKIFCVGEESFRTAATPPGDTWAALLTRLTTQPDHFYVNIHTVNFPGGEIRGQLVNPDAPPA